MHKPKPIKLAKDQYWKLRALLRDVTEAQREAEAHINRVGGIAQTFMKSLGLSTSVNYAMDDKTYSLTESTAVKPKD